MAILEIVAGWLLVMLVVFLPVVLFLFFTKTPQELADLKFLVINSYKKSVDKIKTVKDNMYLNRTIGKPIIQDGSDETENKLETKT